MNGQNQRLVQIQPSSFSSLDCTQDLRKGGRWFNSWGDQYSFSELLMVIATRFIPLSPLSIVSKIVKWESSQWLGKNIVWITYKKDPQKAWTGALITLI